MMETLEGAMAGMQDAVDDFFTSCREMGLRLDEREGAGRIRPLADVTSVWSHTWSDYPDMIRVAMADGHTVAYYRQIEQPKPVLRKALDDFNETCQIGYQKKEREE